MPDITPLSQIQRDSLVNSRRWFPVIHSRPLERQVLHAGLGVGGEAGEVVDIIKKVDVCGSLSETCDMHKHGKHSRQSLADEMADVLTYLCVLAELCDIDLAEAWQRKQLECEDRWG